VTGIGWIWWVAGVLSLGLAALGTPLVYLAAVLAWGEKRTRGLEYYGRPPDERARFRGRLASHARLLRPVVRTLARLQPARLSGVTFEVEGIPGPKGTCSAESFRRGMEYRPRPNDVFVVTAMKCGTTWMQQAVFEVLMRGRGDLVESGTALYAVSPWLEGETSVSVDEAPEVGAGPRKRILKTHLPASACPRDPAARYVYVSRDPVSCFASCRDFLATNMGPFCPDLDDIADWYLSDGMWWGPWPEHVRGWWDRAQADGNVLWVRFEDMVADLPAVLHRIADFLEVAPLEDAETKAAAEKCGFDYMKRHSHVFEMHPPHLLAADPLLFVRGTGDRFRDVSPELDARIRDWCARELAGTAFPLDELYPRVDR
jgi:hypothetical protein